jgi:hypothetical protein
VVVVETAAELLRELDPQSSRWHGDPKAWLFRGHWDVSWALLPAAYRSQSWRRFRGGRDDSLAPHALEALTAKALFEFGRRMDESGLSIPSHHRLETWNLEQLHHETLVSEPDIWPFVALAQHHGLPTGLLDWTRVAHFGAYFAAASDGAPDNSRRLAIWALSERFVRRAESSAPPWTMTAPVLPRIRLVTAPRASNPNLHAQAGLFVVWERAEQGLSLDEAIEVWSYRASSEVSQTPALLRFEMPQAEAPELLRLLSYYNTDAARLFPGCAGVVRAIQEQRLE